MLSSPRSSDALELRIETMRWVAEDVITVELVSLDATMLPAWTPGAHVDLELPSGMQHRFALCGAPGGVGSYRIMVDRNDGPVARELHDTALIGRTLRAHEVANQFPMRPALSYVFVADGLGVAPILAMAARASEQRVPWRLVYAGRTLSAMPFIDELRSLECGRLELVPEDELGRPDLGSVLARVPDGAEVYASGPARLVDAVTLAGRLCAADRVHVRCSDREPEPAVDPRPGRALGQHAPSGT
ncbi:ferredoxin reductase [Nocardioides sp. BP30]|uniref:ferredoxin reductase n=1 Tax=Nocardioides sp. BP30 TaxID=3036374 RepID=UPI002468CB98|nr:ferredoxin reductase [Nocardioides sp. BP30]WGL50782.1 ferredoxin reductase [Nocardioides sp. BP30]